LVSNWKLLGLGIVVENIGKASDYYLELGFPLNSISKEYELQNIKSNQIGVGPIVFEFLEATSKSSVYQNCYDKRGEGIAEIIFIVKDLKLETEGLTKKGVSLIDSSSNHAILDTRKEGNMLTRLIKD